MQADDTAGALELLRRLWGLQVDPNSGFYTGTFWEFVMSNGLPDRGFDSLAHAWGAGPDPDPHRVRPRRDRRQPRLLDVAGEAAPGQPHVGPGTGPDRERLADRQVGPGHHRSVPPPGHLTGRHQRRGVGAAGFGDEHQLGPDRRARRSSAAAGSTTSTPWAPGPSRSAPDRRPPSATPPTSPSNPPGTNVTVQAESFTSQSGVQVVNASSAIGGAAARLHRRRRLGRLQQHQRRRGRVVAGDESPRPATAARCRCAPGRKPAPSSDRWPCR